MNFVIPLIVIGILFVCAIVLSSRKKVNILKSCGIVIKRVLIFPLYIIFFLFLVCIGGFSFPFLLCSRTKYHQEDIRIADLRPGDLIMTGSNGTFKSLPIKLANILTNGIESKYWTHIAIHIGDGKLIEARAKSGVQSNSVENYKRKGSLIKVYRHKFLNEDNAPEFFKAVVTYCKDLKQEKCKYGFGALFFYALSIGMPNILDWAFDDPFYDKVLCIENSYFCSELAAEAYEKCGQPITPFDPWRIKPSDFMGNPLFKEVLFHTLISEDITNEMEVALTLET